MAAVRATSLPKLLTYTEVMAALNVRRSTVQLLVRQGDLEVIDITGTGRAPRITEESVRAHLDRNRR